MSKGTFSRREFIGTVAALPIIASTGFSQKKPAKIDRFALVTRHNPKLKMFDSLSPLSVGNGEFAFTADVTGLQTFPEEYAEKFPLCTMSNWGWHSIPRPKSLEGKTLKLKEYDTYGRKVGYQSSSEGQKELYDWMRQNPHRLNLAQIGLRLIKSDGNEAKPSDISDIEQTLDLWSGIITSKFKFAGNLVIVTTCVHPTEDILAVKIESELIKKQQLSVKIAFPYGSPNMSASDWSSPEKHKTSIRSEGERNAIISRSLDNDSYTVDITFNSGKFAKSKEHEFILEGDLKTLEFFVGFTPESQVFTFIPSTRIFNESQRFWKNFWSTGGTIDLSQTVDKRAFELERRIILSQYLTAINCSGKLPPQETGLAINSWYGKFHLEMHWWHSAHFALWNRLPMFEKSLDWYISILKSSRERATQQGYKGIRFPKMTEPLGTDAPSPIGPLLIWQQPHPIFYAELVYQSKPTRQTLKKYAQLVFEAAEFMADFAHFDGKRYVLGPPVIPAQENHPAIETWNPTFELEYWRFGLKTANDWKKRLGLQSVAKWDEVVAKLSPLPSKNGVYLAHENCPQTFSERNIDHPSMLGAYGILKGEMVDKSLMRNTLHKVMKEWNWDDTWGWDYPMTAMTAAKLGEPKIAIEALLKETPKNHYSVNGHNYQRPNLPCYLPGNGGLLYAIAMMAGGWENSPKQNAAGFPKDWKVRHEGFNYNLLSKF
jgi:protein-glucosylgalactosylhydroxylysine glucosidase